MRKGSGMIDLKAVEVELHNARRARISAELACCEIEELAEYMRFRLNRDFAPSFRSDA
jgi:hypothetical protein